MEIFPLNFLDTYSVDGHTIKYSDFREIAQGGPEVGAVTLDGKAVGMKGDYFGGPPIFYEGKMFVPRLKRTLVGRYFRICVVDLRDRSMKEFGDRGDLVLLSNVDETFVYFFRENPNTKLKSIRWN